MNELIMKIHSLILLCLPLLFIEFVRADIVRHDDGFSASFNVVNIGRVEAVIMWVEDVSQIECGNTCILHLQCKSINYQTSTRMCELADREFEEGILVDRTSSDWMNYGTPKPVDGSFSEWMDFSECSKSCGVGMRTRRRFCDNPIPMYGGRDCVGKTSIQIECNMQPCPKNLALGKPAQQSSNAGGRKAKYGNDGQLSTTASTAFNRRNGWWQVDLGNVSIIDHIELYLIESTLKSGHYKNMVVYGSINQTVWTSYKNIGRPTSINLTITPETKPYEARYVKIQNGKFMALKECMVYSKAN